MPPYTKSRIMVTDSNDIAFFRAMTNTLRPRLCPINWRFIQDNFNSYRAFSILILLVLPCFTFKQAAALEVLAGKVIQGGLIVLKTKPSADLTINGKNIMVTPEGLAVTGFHRDDTTTLIILAKHPNGNVRRLQLKPEIRVYQEQRIDGLPSKMVTPPAEVLERIARDRQLVNAARAHASKISAFSGRFSWPINGIITGVYGSRRILNGKPRAPHYGIDIAAPEGTPISAPQTGTVRMVSDLYFTGWTIILDHGHGVSSTFLHLKNATVKIGNKVKKGEIIGTVGSTGRSTGAHLDWRINLFNKRLDPELIAGPMPSK